MLTKKHVARRIQKKFWHLLIFIAHMLLLFYSSFSMSFLYIVLQNKYACTSHLTQTKLIFSLLMYDSSCALENTVLSVIFVASRTLIFGGTFCRWRSFIFGGALILSVTNVYFRRMAPVNKKKSKVDWGSWALVNIENSFQVQERRQCLNSGDGLPNRHSETTAELHSVKRITNVAATFLLRLQSV